MELRHIPLEDLKPATVNVRHGNQTPDISDILPSIRKRGILQPLLVRPNGKGYEIVAGRRRFFAATMAAKETGKADLIPCAIMEKGGDAAAVEASLLENIARLPMDPMDQYEAFARLAKQGKEVADIAETFGITERMVKSVLALANLILAIRTLYRKDEIDASTLRILTMASKAQQKEWLKLRKDEEAYAPLGEQLKRWLFGGDNIRTSAALFDLADYKGEVVTDLFGEDSYFADSNLFWQMQDEAIETRRQTLLDKGWTSVEVFERGQYFSEWDYEKTAKKDGGRVFVTIRHNGEVAFHEGYVTRREARANELRANGQNTTDAGNKPVKPEITKAMQTYLELHRHALVRADLLKHPAIALRLAVAHMIAGSGHWSIRPEPQRAQKPEIAASVQGSGSQQEFDKEREAVLTLLDINTDRAELVRHNGDSYPAAMLFMKLLTLPDAEVMRVMTFAMAETLQAGSCIVEAVGVHLGVENKGRWRADDVFLDLMKDKATINAVLESIGGKQVAGTNATKTGKVQKGIIADCLKGENGRKKIKDWTPNWLNFPFESQTDTPIESTGIGAEWLRVAGMVGQREDAAVRTK